MHQRISNFVEVGCNL